MKKTLTFLLSLAALMTTAQVALAEDPILTLNMVGTGTMYEGTVPDIDGDGVDDPASCFDLDVMSLTTGAVIGTATDCIANVTADGDGMKLVGTTYFNLNGNSQLVTRATVTVHPGQADSLQGFTHITGSAPTGGNDVLSGTTRFQDATGSVRLSGMVDLSSFTGAVGDPITFNCIFVVRL